MKETKQIILQKDSNQLMQFYIKKNTHTPTYTHPLIKSCTNNAYAQTHAHTRTHTNTSKNTRKMRTVAATVGSDAQALRLVSCASAPEGRLLLSYLRPN